MGGLALWLVLPVLLGSFLRHEYAFRNRAMNRNRADKAQDTQNKQGTPTTTTNGKR